MAVPLFCAIFCCFLLVCRKRAVMEWLSGAFTALASGYLPFAGMCRNGIVFWHIHGTCICMLRSSPHMPSQERFYRVKISHRISLRCLRMSGPVYDHDFLVTSRCIV